MKITLPALPDLRKPHLQIPLIYALLAALWIAFSDEIVSLIGVDRDTVIRLSIFKGWFFVAVTALLLQHLIRRNFSALERSRATLAASEERFAAAFRLSPMAIAISSFQEGRLLEVNDAWLRTFGFLRDEVVGRTVEELGIDEEGGVRGQVVESIGEGGEARNLELRLLRKTGESIEVLFSADSIYLSEKRYLLVVILDITARRRAEAALKQQAHELRERNQELARYNSAVVDRELRVIELKEQVNALSSRLGEPPPFRLAFLQGHDAERGAGGTPPPPRGGKSLP